MANGFFASRITAARASLPGSILQGCRNDRAPWSSPFRCEFSRCHLSRRGPAGLPRLTRIPSGLRHRAVRIRRGIEEQNGNSRAASHKLCPCASRGPATERCTNRCAATWTGSRWISRSSSRRIGRFSRGISFAAGAALAGMPSPSIAAVMPATISERVSDSLNILLLSVGD